MIFFNQPDSPEVISKLSHASLVNPVFKITIDVSLGPQ